MWHRRRDERTPEQQAAEEEFWRRHFALSIYNLEVSRGLVHTPEWRDLMAGYQAEQDLIESRLRRD